MTWRDLLGWPVQPFAELVADARFDQALRVPSTDRRALDAEQLADLGERTRRSGCN